jgi:hypothetical protein
MCYWMTRRFSVSVTASISGHSIDSFQRIAHSRRGQPIDRADQRTRANPPRLPNHLPRHAIRHQDRSVKLSFRGARLVVHAAELAFEPAIRVVSQCKLQSFSVGSVSWHLRISARVRCHTASDALRRTPRPPPLVNSIPADSKARLSAVTVELWAAKVPGATSSRLIVASDIPEASARSRCSQRNSARAARINSLVMASESSLSWLEIASLGLIF